MFFGLSGGIDGFSICPSLNAYNYFIPFHLISSSWISWSLLILLLSLCLSLCYCAARTSSTSWARWRWTWPQPTEIRTGIRNCSHNYGSRLKGRQDKFNQWLTFVPLIVLLFPDSRLILILLSSRHKSFFSIFLLFFLSWQAAEPAGSVQAWAGRTHQLGSARHQRP